jgi:hypothetical protein
VNQVCLIFRLSGSAIFGYRFTLFRTDLVGSNRGPAVMLVSNLPSRVTILRMYWPPGARRTEWRLRAGMHGGWCSSQIYPNLNGQSSGQGAPLRVNGGRSHSGSATTSRRRLGCGDVRKNKGSEMQPQNTTQTRDDEQTIGRRRPRADFHHQLGSVCRLFFALTKIPIQ